ncbi:MAG: hypothetical protein CL610_01045 [Anaerolineaceae bacterium]|nr:hypothetical protein [Anaerolineaceae bacterium]
MNEKSYHRTLALILVAFSIGMSALISNRVFERLPHLEDEVAYLFQAKTYAGGQLVVDIPEARRAYWQPFVVDYTPAGNRFSKYTPGWPMLLAMGVLLGQAWVINALLSGLNVALVYRLGREVFSPDAGLIAAALTAFSPMALLLNSTLMGHTAALCGVTLFMYAYWRIERGRHALRWGVVAGLALGLVIATRPLTAIGMTFPFILWSGFRVLRADIRYTRNHESAVHVRQVLTPLLTLAAVTLLISAVIPIYSYAATGDPTKNLYTLVWSYDRVGFGECCGRNGHTLEKGLRHVRFDLSLMAADLFGWQLQDVTGLPRHIGQWLTTGEMGTSITPALQDHLQTEGDYWLLTGISWILLPFGLLVGFRKRWTWLLAGAALSLIAVHMAYWIGSQRYSTRYYFETLQAFALLSALPIAWLIQRTRRRWLIYALLTASLIYTLYAYSTPRIHALYRFNFITPEVIEGVNARRSSDEPVLVVVTGTDVRWRALGALMSQTSPYLDSDIVVAWDNLQPGLRDQIEARFRDREIIEMAAEGNNSWFVDEPPAR